MLKLIGNDWDELLKDEFKKDYFTDLMQKVNDEYSKHKVFPKYEDIFNALKHTAYKDVKAVILGQDPYYHPNEAHGFSFSVPKGIKIPKSLENIYTEISDDIGSFTPTHGNLVSWALQGVLLINTILTVRENEPGSHRNLGWERFTDQIISLLNHKKDPVVFLLWGNFAKSKEKLIDSTHHLILSTVHPSPLSSYRGFFGCKHFSKTNEFLRQNKKDPINWIIE